MDWIVQQLFVGNKLWSQEKPSGGKLFDLRKIQTPIILFASMGDNITPPQQAFNWVADVYGSTEEIKARGQTIIGLVYGHIGHLGIFVSGKVAKKEYASIVSVLKSVEALRPGLYAMKINTLPADERGKITYEIEFEEHRLEDIRERINRFGRTDERPFQAAAVSAEFNQRLYEAFLQPIVQRMSNDFTAKLARVFHPLRVQHWALSDMSPCLAWLGGGAALVNANRHAAGDKQPLRRMEQAMSELVSASLDYYRIKFTLFRAEDELEPRTVLCRGQIDSLGEEPNFVAEDSAGCQFANERLLAGATHEQALDFLMRWGQCHFAGHSLVGAGHRVVHGGAMYSAPVVVDPSVMANLEELVCLAPLHQPHNLAGIKALAKLHPKLPQVACFDTAFHHTQPTVASSFALPRALTEAGIRRYGFHGLSYEYIASVLPDYAGSAAEGKVVVAHLGQGASMCAMQARRSVATTMGFSAVDGLPMGKCCGALDPGVVTLPHR
jgi:hypothetical protein